MTSGFSGVVRLSNVDDFIAPSQDCIIPLMGRLKPAPVPTTEPIVPTTSATLDEPADVKRKRPSTEAVKLETSTAYTSTKAISETKEMSVAETVKISLNDCLACSGCITSAESVLVEQQSYKAFKKILDDRDAYGRIIVSVSPQSLASLAAEFSLTMGQTAHRLSSFLLSKGVNVMIDTSIARTITLLALQDELRRSLDGDSTAPTLPILSSACPGWICLAEKSHAWILPHISRVRSPMATMGAYVKHKYGPTSYHCSIMPCYDKKLEASRSSLTSDDKQPETDCVVGTAELLEWFAEDGVDFVNLPTPLPSASILDPMSYSPTTGECKSHEGGASGGYAWHAIQYAKNVMYANVPTVIRNKRVNKDMDEWALHREDNNEPLLRVARAYGFKNVQNVVLKMKREKSTSQYSFIEMMACPSGCINGGGQIKPESMADRKIRLAAVQALYDDMPIVETLSPSLANSWLGADWLTSDRLHTEYTAMVANELANALVW